MAITVEVPQLGNTVEECLIARWVKRKGDLVSAGDIVAEIETDKTTFEITAPIAGTILETLFDEGAVAPVFAGLFIIGAPDEAVASASARTELQRPDGREGGPVLSPRARKFAAAHNFAVPSLHGSGPGGRVLEADVRQAFATAGMSQPASNVRHTIARRMRESLAATAQYTLHASADARALLAARARNKASGGTITIGDYVAFCAIQALGQAPDLNAEFVAGTIVKHSKVRLAFACDTTSGLIAPVVRDAHALTIDALSARIKELSAQATAGTLAPSDLSGATFSISNLGSLGIESFTPVLNPPQVAILGVGAIQLRPVRTKEGVDFVETIGLSLTCDHQVIDGAPGARFLQLLARHIEAVA
jgi:pyruvate dehydrogenase E2 component (dihydrolipoamide acetyltransferase)